MAFNKDVMFSSATEEWATPQNIFDTLDREFNFTLDPCATSENAKCKLYYTKKENRILVKELAPTPTHKHCPGSGR